MAPTVGEISFQASPQGAYLWWAFMPSGAGHRGVTCCGCAVICFPGACCPCHVLSMLSVPTGHKGTVLAIRLMRHSDEHAVESSQSLLFQWRARRSYSGISVEESPLNLDIFYFAALTLQLVPAENH